MRYHKHIKKEYAKAAERYDLKHQKFLSSTQRAAFEVLNPRKDERVLDAGCGTGAVTKLIADKLDGTGEVVGIDVSERMLDKAKEKLRGYSNVVLRCGDTEAIPYPDDYFDGVISANAIHYHYDVYKALNEFGRVIKTSGRFVISGFCTDFIIFRFFERIWRITNPSHRRAYGLDELSRNVSGCGFEVTAKRRWKAGWFWGCMVIGAVKR